MKSSTCWRYLPAVLLLASVAWSAGCGGKKDEPQGGAKSKWVVLDIMTDNKDLGKAKDNAEQTIAKHPDVACMVGLWAYNPPLILQAVKQADKVGKIKIIGFDEDAQTLAGIRSGEIEATVIQQPYLFGFRSVEYLSAIARGESDKVRIPTNKMIFIPHVVVDKSNIVAVEAEVAAQRKGTATPPKADAEYKIDKKVTVAFLTNSVDPFWSLAEEGCKAAAPLFNAEAVFWAPEDASVKTQNNYMETAITKEYQGIAISSIDPANQVQIMEKVSEKMPMVCVDSDAPKTTRKFYLGTGNYLAGREVGKLIKKACPNGGKVMLFVGRMEVLNAQERSQGVKDELEDKPIPQEYADQRKKE